MTMGFMQSCTSQTAPSPRVSPEPLLPVSRQQATDSGCGPPRGELGGGFTGPSLTNPSAPVTQPTAVPLWAGKRLTFHNPVFLSYRMPRLSFFSLERGCLGQERQWWPGADFSRSPSSATCEQSQLGLALGCHEPLVPKLHDVARGTPRHARF